MDLWSLLQYLLFLLIVALLVKPVGGYLARVFQGQKTFLDPALRPIERLIYLGTATSLVNTLIAF